VVKVKDTESNPDSESDPENIQNIQIIDAYPTSIITTTKIEPEESIYHEEGECLFHSRIWVKGTPLHFIVDNNSKKNIISAKVINQLGFSTTPRPQPYNIRWLHHG
jgi:hypothetical protein